MKAIARVLSIGTAVVLGLFGPKLWSQEAYPSKPIRLVVALGPGSGADALARFLAAELQRDLQVARDVAKEAGIKQRQ